MQRALRVQNATYLRWIQRLRLRGTMSSLRKTQAKILRAEERLELLQEETRHQHLKIKELKQREAQEQHRLRELYPMQVWPLEPLVPQQKSLNPKTPQLSEREALQRLQFVEGLATQR